MNTVATICFALSGLGAVVNLLAVACLLVVVRRRAPLPTKLPGISMLKPLCGLDDELLQNLESHLAVEYAGDWELVLGLRSREDPAAELAERFAAAYPERVRLVMQAGEAGYNRKVNQLVTLTEAARFEVVSITDSNVRVAPSLLREIAAMLERPNVGIATHLFTGVGEKRLGAVLDNLTLVSYCTITLASASVLLGLDEVVGKSMAMRKETLERAGGWRSVQNRLAEDQQIGHAFRDLGLHAAHCPTQVENVQVTQSFADFWKRHTRWLLIRYRTFFPGVLGEPVFLPIFWALLGALCLGLNPHGWLRFGSAWLFMAFMTQTCALLTRKHLFRWDRLLWLPVREIAFFAMWVRAATMRTVEWRGHRLHVLHGTRLAPPEVMARVKSRRRRGR